MRTRRRLVILIGGVCALALSAHAWDVEHEVIAQLTGEFLPSDIKSFLTSDDFSILLENCHYPDEYAFRKYHSLDDIAKIVGPADAEAMWSGCRNTCSCRSFSRATRPSTGRRCGSTRSRRRC